MENQLKTEKTDPCRVLAEQLYQHMHMTGKGSEHWDHGDDEREITTITEQIQAIVKEAYAAGGDIVHKLLTQRSKTYRDLTDHQLLELAALAHDQPAVSMVHVNRINPCNPSVDGINGVRVEFNTAYGIISRTRNGLSYPTYNLFQIVDKCREWGVSY